MPQFMTPPAQGTLQLYNTVETYTKHNVRDNEKVTRTVDRSY